jgi:hypothetical protein
MNWPNCSQGCVGVGQDSTSSCLRSLSEDQTMDSMAAGDHNMMHRLLSQASLFVSSVLGLSGLG